MSEQVLVSPEVTTAEESPSQKQIAAPPARSEQPASSAPSQRARRRAWPWVVGLIAFAMALAVGIPRVNQSLGTVSTDDAYVNGHVTFVAPRVAGQVKIVLVDDNNLVHKGDLLVELDPE